MQLKSVVPLGFIALNLVGAIPARAASLLLEWNETALDAIRTERIGGPVAGRALAITYTSVFDAVNGIDRADHPAFNSYYVQPTAGLAGVSKEAAATAAAHRALVNLFPSQQSTFDALFQTTLLGIADGDAKTQGIEWGEYVADRILALRSNDNSNLNDPDISGSGIGEYAGPSGLYQYRQVAPFAMTSPSQFRPGPPVALDSVEYAEALNEVKRLGSVDSQERTAEQTEIGLFWLSGLGSPTGAGDWLEIGQIYAEQEQLSLSETARLFALLGIGIADAGISSWESKAYYDFWRPQEAIRQADLDGNPLTEADPTWQSLNNGLGGSSEYTAGHPVFSSAAASILALFHGSDDYNFSLSLDPLGPSVVRSFTRFSQASEESARSRIYAGVHFETTTRVSLGVGQQIGQFVSATQLQPRTKAVPEPSSLVALGLTGWGLFALKRRRQSAQV